MEWECPHCGEKNYIDEMNWSIDEEGGVVVGYEQCPQCECYAHVEFEKVIHVCARSITRDEIPAVIHDLGISADDANEREKLEESIDKDD
jgi:predicted nucleic-acid-binding Zn-ribbon protein